MKNRLIIIAGVSVGALFFFQCKEPIREKIDLVKAWQFSFEDSTKGCNIVWGDAVEGKAFTRTNDKFNYSAGLAFPIPDSLIGVDLRINIECSVRNGTSGMEHAVVVSFQNGDTTSFWNTFMVDNFAQENDKWARLVDSTLVSASTNNRKGMEMRIFGWNPKGSSYFDMDDLKITLKKVQTTGFN